MEFSKRITIVVALAFAAFIGPTRGANILALFTTHCRSQLIIDMAVVRALAEHQHNITIVTTLNLDQDLIAAAPSIRHIKLPSYSFRSIYHKMIHCRTLIERFTNSYNYVSKLMEYSKIALNSSAIRSLMTSDNRFDATIISIHYSKFELGLAGHFRCPTILISHLSSSYGVDRLIGNPYQDSSYASGSYVGGITGFYGRFVQKLYHYAERFAWWHISRMQQAYYNELFPSKLFPSLEEIQKNVSLLLIDSHFTRAPIKANVPAVIDISGIQVEGKDSSNLNQDIKMFLDSAELHGAILFSLGSHIEATDLDAEFVDKLFTVFATLEQKVIMKWSSEAAVAPVHSKNILLHSYLPQADILAHPNLRLFITHGGRSSVAEAEYFGVPMIGLPIFAEHSANVNKFVEQGAGIRLPYQHFTEDELKAAINEILNNRKYAVNINKTKRLLGDRLNTARQSVVFWTEYVIRYEGARHMQSSVMLMADYEVWGLDVIAALLMILLAVCGLVWYCFRLGRKKWLDYCNPKKPKIRRRRWWRYRKNKKPDKIPIVRRRVTYKIKYY